jgi:hypothetical protein
MSQVPAWYNQLTWSVPMSVALVRSRIQARQNPIPPRPGCYVFTGAPDALVPGRYM